MEIYYGLYVLLKSGKHLTGGRYFTSNIDNQDVCYKSILGLLIAILEKWLLNPFYIYSLYLKILARF